MAENAVILAWNWYSDLMILTWIWMKHTLSNIDIIIVSDFNYNKFLCGIIATQ